MDKRMGIQAKMFVFRKHRSFYGLSMAIIDFPSAASPASLCIHKQAT